MGRGVQITVAVLITLEIALLATWGATLLDESAPAHDLRVLGVALFLATTATVIAAIAMIAARPHFRSQGRLQGRLHR